MQHHRRAAARALASVALASAAVAIAPAAQAQSGFLQEAEVRDGVLQIEIVGRVPFIAFVDDDTDEDDPGILKNTDNVQEECFRSYKDETSTFDVLTSDTWGSDAGQFEDVDRVEIRFRDASEFGFNGDADIPNSDLSCSDFQEQWDAYEGRDSATLFVLSGLTFASGDAGTEIQIDEGFEFNFAPGATFKVDGTADDPVVVTGTQWNGLTLSGNVTGEFSDCEVSRASGNAGISARNGAQLDIERCLISGNEGRRGGGVRVETGAEADLEDVRLEDNEAQLGGGLYAESPADGLTLTDVALEGNEAFSRGGGIYLENATNVRLQNVSVVDSESGRGAGVFVRQSEVRMWNPLIAGNSSRRDGGGLKTDNLGLTVTLDNPTIVFNEAENGGGIAVSGLTAPVVRNGIVTRNRLRVPDGDGSQLFNESPTGADLRRVLVSEGRDEGIDGPLNEADLVEAAPEFRSPPDEAGEGGGSSTADFRLDGRSAAVNAGDGTLFDTSGFRSVDRDDSERIFGNEAPAIDLGAFEFPNNPPTLLDKTTETFDTDEDDPPLALRLCDRYTDSDTQPAFPNARRRPWLTRGPADDAETLERNVDQDETSSEAPFGEILAYDGGEAGDRVRTGSAIGDPQGRAFFDPANRSAAYSVVIECRVNDQLVDAEGDTNRELSLFSRSSKRVEIAVEADNDQPDLQGNVDQEATVGRGFESTITIGDPDADQAERSLQARLVSAPEWLELERTAADEIAFSGTPDTTGEVEVQYEVIDPDGGTRLRTATIDVGEPEALDPVNAGDDTSAEPGDRVRLRAQGPAKPGLTYRWRIIDGDDEQIARQKGRTFNWQAQKGSFTAQVRLIEAGDVADRDSLSISVDAGLTGGVEEQQTRSEPSDEEKRNIDGMSDSGSAENTQEWENQSESEKAEALADIGQRDLTAEQRNVVIDEVDEVLQDATAGGSSVPEDVAEGLAKAQSGLAGAELDGDQQARVADGIAALRTAAEDAGNATAAVRSGIVDATGGMLTEQDVGAEVRSQLANAIEGDVNALQQRLADPAAPFDADLAAAAANAVGRVAGAQLTGDERDAVQSVLEQVRQRATQEGEASAAVTAGLVRGASGLLARGERVAPSRRDALLSATASDLRRSRDRDQKLPLIAGNRALAALDNARKAGALGADQIEDIVSATSDVLAVVEPLTAEHLGKAVVTLAQTAAEVGPKKLTDGQTEAMRSGARAIAKAAMRTGESLNATGSALIKVAGERVVAGTGGEIIVGKDAPQGPKLVISESARAELRRRNGVSEDTDLAFAVVATRLNEGGGYIVELLAIAPASGESLTDVALEQRVQATIPVTADDERDPVRVGATATTTNVVSRGGRGVAFDTGELDRYTLSSEVEDSSGRGGSDKSGCFLDSVF